MQALILAGGEGTRLRPLTSTMPKPVVPLAGRPFIAFMIDWLVGHGVRDVILGCGFMAEEVRAVMGDGSDLGVRLRYLEEPHPLGTGGALKFAQELLEERFFVLNGDVLTDIDLTAQLEQHERTGARTTIALIGVEDPSAYGLVRLGEDFAVREFLEKPRPEEIDTDLVNAGAYILEREVLEEIGPAGATISIERDLFPKLTGRGLFGRPSRDYWLDIGTPERYLQGTFDILEGNVTSSVAISAGEGSWLVAPALIGERCSVAEGAQVGGRCVLGDGVQVGPGARISDSVVLDNTIVGAGSAIAGAIVARDVRIGERCQIAAGAVVGDGVRIGAGNVVGAGARIFPGVELLERDG